MTRHGRHGVEFATVWVFLIAACVGCWALVFMAAL